VQAWVPKPLTFLGDMGLGTGRKIGLRFTVQETMAKLDSSA
jgi:hypothetical protein